MTIGLTGATVMQGVVMALLAVGIGKCVMLARRPKTSARCALALAVVLAAVLLGYTASLLDWARLHPAAPAVATGGMVAILLGGVALAIMGWVECKRRPDYTQGRAQAIAAIATAGAVLFVTAAVLVPARARAGETRAPIRVRAGEVVQFADYHFRFRVPRGWAQVDAGTVNPAAQLILVRLDPQLSFMLIAEKSPRADIDSRTLAAINRASIRAGADAATVSEPAPYPVNRFNGSILYSDVVRQGQKTSYVHWMLARNGYCYQLITFGPTSESDRVRKEADRLIDGFRPD